MIRISDTLYIPEEELVFTASRSGGPGGQNVNKVSTACQLRFDAANCPALSEPVRRRLMSLARPYLTACGELVITAREHRTQRRNRDEAVGRLVELVLGHRFGTLRVQGGSTAPIQRATIAARRARAADSGCAS